MQHPMTDPRRSKDITIFVVADNAKINGDPLKGGDPRVDPLTGVGLLSSQAYMRKVRDYAYDIHGVSLAVPQEGIKSEIRDSVEDTTAFVRGYWDQRLLGGVTLKMKGPKALGHGPFHLNGLCPTVCPVEVIHTGITCAAGEKADKGKDGLRANMGTKSVIRHGLYIVRGSYDATRGIRNNVSEKDLEILFDGLFACWDHTISASRVGVHIHAALIATHPGVRRSENTLVASRRFQAIPVGSASNSAADYDIVFNDEDAPQGMDFHQFTDTVNGFTP